MNEQEVQIVQLIEVRFRRGAGTDDDPVREIVSYRQLDGALVAEIDPCETSIIVAPPKKSYIPRLRIGDERMLTLLVRARITEACDTDNGTSYELELERRMFNDGRIVGIDADEIVDVEMVQR